MTFVYVTHDQEEAMRMSDRIAVMNNGKDEQVGSPEEIYDQPKTRFVAGFIGESNFFESKKFSLNDTKVEVYLMDALTISGRRPDGYVPSSKLTLAVRPEKIRIISNGHSSASNENRLLAAIEELIDLACVGNGGNVVAASDMFFGNKENLIMLGRAANMGDGGETKPRRGPGYVRAIVRFGKPGLSRTDARLIRFTLRMLLWMHSRGKNFSGRKFFRKQNCKRTSGISLKKS
jgi:hypothetical protein